MLLKKVVYGFFAISRTSLKIKIFEVLVLVGRKKSCTVYVLCAQLWTSPHSSLSVARMLRSLLSADGVTPHMITVFIDGYFEVSSYIGLLSIPENVSRFILCMIFTGWAYYKLGKALSSVS